MFLVGCHLLEPLLRIVNLHWYVFCLLVVLVKLSVIAKQLARKTSPRKPNRGEGIISTKPRLKSIFLERERERDRESSVSLCACVVQHNIFHTPTARYSLFVLKVSLNISKPNLQHQVPSE